MSNKNEEYNLKILKRFSQNFSTFNKIENFATNKTNLENEKIIFNVYLEKTRYDEQYYNIVFHAKTNIKATCNYIKDNHKKDLLNKNIGQIVFLFKNKRTTEKAKDIVSQTINPKKTYYIETLIKEISETQLNNAFDKTEFITPKAFTFPNIKYLKENEEYNNFKKFNEGFLNNWFDTDNSSILVIKGEGGIGKTTIAKYFGNYFINNKEDSSKIFIDSLEAKNYLLNNHDTSIDLYDLYVASLNGTKALDKELFIDNLDAGNFFLIIDGIDELISKVENFSIENFLKSISNFTSEIKNTKIIITCRTYFWDFEDSSKYNIECIEISPFNLKQTTFFFNQSFKNDKNKTLKAVELAQEFHKTNNDEEYFQPYALDIIYNLINSKKEIIEKNLDTFSQLLNPNETIDYIIDRICFRENYLKDKKRILDLNVDEQLMFFKELAVKYNGKISIDLLKKVITESLSHDKEKNIPKTLTEAIKTHPLINIEGGIFKFRYDFFVDFFKSIYLSNFLDYNIGKEIITNDFIELLRNCWFGSSLTKEVSKRVNKWTEEELVKIEDIVDQLENKDIKNKKEVLSGIFNIVFYINKNKKGSNTTENTELVTKIFEKNGQIENLSLINIFDNRYNIKFDFSNKILKNCYFEKYYDFWDCTFNENIYFTNCTMIKLGEKTSKKQILFNINKNVDKNCNYDNTFSNTFIQGGATDEEHKNSIRQFCKNFIHFFYTRGTLWKRNYEIQDKFTPLSIKFHTFGNINLKYNDFLIILNELNFIELTTINGVVKIGVSYEYQSEIIKHIEEGSHSIILNNLIEMIYKITRK